MEIFQLFGVNLYLLAAEIVNFLIVLYVLKRFLYKPIFSMLQKRKSVIEQGLKDTQDAKKRLEKAKEEEKEILKIAHKDADQIITNAKNEAFTIIQTAQDDAKKQTKIMIDDAKEQIAQEQKQTEKRIFTKITSLMANFLEKSTDDLFDKKMQDMLIKNALTKFEKEQKSTKN